MSLPIRVDRFQKPVNSGKKKAGMAGKYTPLNEQRRIVAYLDSFSLTRDLRQARLASLRELQSETQEELDAVMPSILDQAVKGEL